MTGTAVCGLRLLIGPHLSISQENGARPRLGGRSSHHERSCVFGRLLSKAPADRFPRGTTNSLFFPARSSLTWQISPTCAHPRLESVFLHESRSRNQEFLCGLSSYCVRDAPWRLSCLHMTQLQAWLSNYLTELQPGPVWVRPRTPHRRTPSIKRSSDHTGLSLRAQHSEAAAFSMQSESWKTQEMHSEPVHAGLRLQFHPTQAQAFISQRARNRPRHWSLLGFKTVALCSEQCSITDMWREVSA